MPEWGISALGWAVGSLVTVAVTGWILRQSDRPPEASGAGTFVLRYPRVYGWLGGALVVLGLAGVVLGMIWPPEARADWLWAALLFGVFGVPGAMLVLSVLRTFVEVEADGFTVHSWAHAEPRRVLWREVEAVAFSGTMGAFRFDTADGRRVRLSAGMTGMRDLVGAIEALGARGAARAAEQFRSYRSSYGG